MPDTATAPMLLTLSEVCRELRLGRRTANRLLSAGKLPGPDCNVTQSQKGNRWRADRLRAWVSAGCPDAEAWKSFLERAAR